MDDHRKGIWFPVVLIMLVVLIALWFPFRYGRKFLINYQLLHKGIVENAQVVRKGIIVDGKLIWMHQTQPSDNHQFQVKLLSADSGENICQFGVSKLLYDDTPPGQFISVKFLPDYPQECMLFSSIPGTQSILLAGLGLSTFMLLFAFGATFFLYRSYRESGPGDKDNLTTGMEFTEEVQCPKCKEKMTEGYLPMGFGINWRAIDKPVGVPSIFSVLPGTVFWFRRPKLHAYHCERCRIVTFKYGRKKSR